MAAPFFRSNNYSFTKLTRREATHFFPSIKNYLEQHQGDWLATASKLFRHRYGQKPRRRKNNNNKETMSGTHENGLCVKTSTKVWPLPAIVPIAQVHPNDREPSGVNYVLPSGTILADHLGKPNETDRIKRNTIFFSLKGTRTGHAYVSILARCWPIAGSCRVLVASKKKHKISSPSPPFRE